MESPASETASGQAGAACRPQVQRGVEPLLLDVDEVATLLGVGRTFVYELLKHELPHCKLGTRTKVPLDAVRAYVRRRLAEQTAEDDAREARIASRRQGSRHAPSRSTSDA